MSTRFVPVAVSIARRRMQELFRNPGLLLPSLVLPLCFYAAFAGALSAMGDTPEFEYAGNYFGFVFIFCLLLGVCFAAIFTLFGLAEDFQSGFAKRIMLSTPRRMSIVAGFVLASALQAAVVSLVLLGIAAATGSEVSGSVLQVAGLIALAVLLNIAATLFCCGVCLRMQSTEAGPIMMLPVFMLLFVAPVYVTRDQLGGWVATVADVNPITPIYEACRGLLVGAPDNVALAFACSAGMIALLLLWAFLAMKKAQRG